VIVKPEAVRARLLKLEEVISRLEQLGTLDAEALRERFRDAWAAERGLQLGAEVLLDIGNHVLSAEFGVNAKDYEDVIQQLGALKVIDSDLAERLKGLGGFRNILVHGYLRLDPARVADVLARAPRDFNDFAAVMRRWLDNRPTEV
jgi:uncharacterized protein YutE (UPF0331/DUF86 family)